MQKEMAAKKSAAKRCAAEQQLRISRAGTVLLLAALLLAAGAAGAASAASAAETAGTEALSFGNVPESAYAGDIVKIPVTLSGYPRGINQYSVEFTAKAPGLTEADFTVTLERTMIQHTASSSPAVSAGTVQRRYIQTVKMAAFEDYGVEETPVASIVLHLPESESAYDAVISARILESTSGEPLESLAAPSTGDITIHAAPPAAVSDKAPHIQGWLVILIAAAVLIAAGAVCLSRRKRR